MKIFAKAKAVWILFEFLVTVPVVILLMHLRNDKTWYFRRKWSKLQSYLTGYKLEIIGQPDPDVQMILLNHQSLLDIIVMDATYPKDLAWVAKKEIADMPFFGQILTLPRMIIVDREDKKSLVKLLSDTKKRLEEGRVIAMFPEGTRGDGKKLLPFKMGARFVASKLNLKVQPVVIVNSRRILDSLDFTARSGTVKIIYLDPVDPASDKQWYQKLHEDMQKVLDRETKQS
jgi:1-acyl-sn-glycerol-3-phosphate acyltransferase